jgi:CDP-diacylglycerol--glycerol-3-phosphate 3-phosphatidyltransferase
MVSENMKKLPNRITMLRIFLMIGFIPAILAENMIMNYVALLLFALAAISDFFDGYLARKYNVISNFGKVMDPLADKIMVLSALLCFIQLNVVPAWMVIIIIGRDFFLSGIRILAAQQGTIIVASKTAKIKTVVEIVAIIAMLILIITSRTLLYLDIDAGEIGGIASRVYMLKFIPYWLMFITAMTALVSGLEYFFKNKKVFSNEL